MTNIKQLGLSLQLLLKSTILRKKRTSVFYLEKKNFWQEKKTLKTYLILILLYEKGFPLSIFIRFY
jgi:hypothetical protein